LQKQLAVYDDEQWFKDIFAGRPKEEAIRNQSEFFMQRMGGPSLYSDRKGQQTLISRHKSWRVDQAAAERWLFHMEETIKSLNLDDDTRQVCRCSVCSSDRDSVRIT
jgi:truncated hemoglobin YjbI